MKKLFSVLFSASVLTLTACNKEPAKLKIQHQLKTKLSQFELLNWFQQVQILTYGNTLQRFLKLLKRALNSK